MTVLILPFSRSIPFLCPTVMLPPLTNKRTQPPLFLIERHSALDLQKIVIDSQNSSRRFVLAKDRRRLIERQSYLAEKQLQDLMYKRSSWKQSWWEQCGYSINLRSHIDDRSIRSGRSVVGTKCMIIRKKLNTIVNPAVMMCELGN